MCVCINNQLFFGRESYGVSYVNILDKIADTFLSYLRTLSRQQGW